METSAANPSDMEDLILLGQNFSAEGMETNVPKYDVEESSVGESCSNSVLRFTGNRFSPQEETKLDEVNLENIKYIENQSYTEKIKEVSDDKPNTEEFIMPNAEQLESQSSKKKSSKGSYQQTENDFIYVKNQKIPCKTLKEPCSNCYFKCAEKFSLEERRNIFQSFWSLSSDEKRTFYNKFVVKVNVNRRRIIADNKRKLYTYKYFMEQNQTLHRVCRIFFVNTLSINSKRIYYYLNHIKNKADESSLDRIDETKVKAERKLSRKNRVPLKRGRRKKNVSLAEPSFQKFVTKENKLMPFRSLEDPCNNFYFESTESAVSTEDIKCKIELSETVFQETYFDSSILQTSQCEKIIQRTNTDSPILKKILTEQHAKMFNTMQNEMEPDIEPCKNNVESQEASPDEIPATRKKGAKIKSNATAKRKSRAQIDETVNIIRKIETLPRRSSLEKSNNNSVLDREYKSKKKKIEKDPGREVKEPCNNKCCFKCTTKFSFEDRTDIFQYFWSLSDNEKKTFYNKFVIRDQVKRRRKKEYVSTIKQFTYKYFLEKNDILHRVCRIFFLNTLSIDEKRIYYNFNNIKNTGTLKVRKGKINVTLANASLTTKKRKKNASLQKQRQQSEQPEVTAPITIKSEPQNESVDNWSTFANSATAEEFRSLKPKEKFTTDVPLQQQQELIVKKEKETSTEQREPSHALTLTEPNIEKEINMELIPTEPLLTTTRNKYSPLLQTKEEKSEQTNFFVINEMVPFQEFKESCENSLFENVNIFQVEEIKNEMEIEETFEESHPGLPRTANERRKSSDKPSIAKTKKTLKQRQKKKTEKEAEFSAEDRKNELIAAGQHAKMFNTMQNEMEPDREPCKNNIESQEASPDEIYENSTATTLKNIPVTRKKEAEIKSTAKRKSRDQIDETVNIIRKIENLPRRSSLEKSNNNSVLDWEYKSKKRKIEKDPGREVKEPCNNKCCFKCTTKFSFEDRTDIFQYFWSLSENEKKSFYNKFVIRDQVKRRRKKEYVSTIKQFSYKYFLEKNDILHRVCRIFFLNTLSIDEKRIYYNFNNIKNAGTLKIRKGKINVTLGNFKL